MIDNYDSFVYNLVRYVRELGREIVVKRNDEVTLEDMEAMAPSHLMISPGPCSPDEAGVSCAAIKHFAGKIPILGICLGHQAVGQVFGGRVVRAKKPVHGKVHTINHRGRGMFQGAPQDLKVTRYHSLVVERETLPTVLESVAESKEGEIMALVHRTLPVVGVQFHPEAVLTEFGHGLIQNFLEGNYR